MRLHGSSGMSAAYIEQMVCQWCLELLGLPAECGAGIVSGATVANPDLGSACLPDRGSKGRQGFGGRFFESLHEARVLARNLGLGPGVAGAR